MSFKKLVEKCYPVHDLPPCSAAVDNLVQNLFLFDFQQLQYNSTPSLGNFTTQSAKALVQQLRYQVVKSVKGSAANVEPNTHKKMHFCQTSLNVSKSQHGGKWKNKIKVSAARVLSLHKVKQTRNKAQSVFVCVFLCERILHRVDRLDVSCSVSRSKQRG